MRLVVSAAIFCLSWGLAGCQTHFEQAANNGRQLSADVLLSAQVIPRPVPMDEFNALAESASISTQIQGTIELTPLHAASLMDVVSDLEVTNSPLTAAQKLHNKKRAILPVMKLEFVTHAGRVIPRERTFQDSQHFYWDYIFSPGKIWQEASDGDYFRVAMPFSLTEKNQNCVHNGVISFLLSASGATSNYYYQISSETCQYFKANFWGLGQVNFSAHELKDAQQVVQDYQLEKSQRLPVKPISNLSQQYPGMTLQPLSLSSTLQSIDLTLMGVVDNGVHYVSQCETRAGSYPFCDELVVPSFSTAKSMFAALAMLRLEKLYPGTFLQKVSDWVGECQGDQWKNVTFGHLLNMSTGNYQSAIYHEDESAAHVYRFFLATQHQDKVNYSCQNFSRQSEPGTQFVYHSSDTYLLGVALNRFLKSKMGQQADVFKDVLLKDIWPAMTLSPVAYRTRRTLDDSQQAFSGFGLYFTRGDIAKFSVFFNSQLSGPLLDQNKLRSALQQTSEPFGLLAKDDNIRYGNGFWARDVGEFTSCTNDTWLPFMSGFGGISIVFMPGNRLYYYFSDSAAAQYDWQPAISELDKFNPLCNNNNNGS